MKNTAAIEIWMHIASYQPAGMVIPLLNNTELTFYSGEITALIGPSGSGKTTLIKLLLGAADAGFKGELQYRMPDRQTMGPRQVCNAGLVGFMAPDVPLIPWSDIFGNISLPTFLNSQIKLPKKQDIDVLLDDLKIPLEARTRRPTALSFGMRQRVAFARCLLAKPRILYLDEAFTGLDSENVNILGRKLKDYVRATDAACLLVTHDIPSALVFSDSFFVIYGNQKIVRCTAGDVEKTLLRQLSVMHTS